MAHKEVLKKRIDPHPPYDMERVLGKLKSDPLFHVDEQQNLCSFAVRVKEKREESEWKNVISTIRSVGTVDNPQLEWRVYGPPLTEDEKQWLYEHVLDRFEWQSTQLIQFYTEASQYPSLERLVQLQRGLPLIKYEGVYEGFIHSIIQQQINFRFAQQLTFTLAHQFGEVLEWEGRIYPLLPTPSKLSRVEVDELWNRKFSRRKAEYMICLAQLIEQRELDLAHVQHWKNEEFLRRMTAIRGIGTWTVECVLVFCLARPNVFPAGDIALQKAIQKLEGWGQRPTPEECRRWLEPYQQWGSYIAVYLWGLLGE